MNRRIFDCSRIRIFSLLRTIQRVDILITLRFFLSSRQGKPYFPLQASDSNDGEEEMVMHSVAEQKTS